MRKAAKTKTQSAEKNKRKAISASLRFDILTRDGFMCRYCGAKPSGDGTAGVELVVDHVIPVSKGGWTEPDNLITACWLCNSGKRAKTVPSEAPSLQDAENREMERVKIAELVEKARQYAENVISLERYMTQIWCRERQSTKADSHTLKIITGYARSHGVEQVCEWIEIATSRKSVYYSDQDIGRYISGIRRKWLEEQEHIKSLLQE